VKKVFRFLNGHFEECCMGVFLVAMTLVMFLQIALRLFGTALSWPEEFSRYCFVYITFLSIGYCVQRSSMLRVDFLAQILPKKASKIIDLLIAAVCLALYVYLFVASVSLVQQVSGTGRVSTAIQIPYTVIYFSLIIGFVMAVLRSVQTLLHMFRTFHTMDEKGGQNG